ncbi:MAG TPA: hypothetical protein VJ249_03410 [Candidatus Bathyarchaeia archaeon]|nr:hypothetical protein [Candidatus Bathyarchaeia archaeon]
MEKVEVKHEESGPSPPVILAEMPTGSPQATNDQMQESLKVLSEETLQLSELIWHESKLTREFCALLKQVLRQLNMSFNLPVSIFPHGQKLQQVILNPEAHLILINDKNEVESKALDDCSPDIVFNLVSFIIPELSKSLTLYRQKVSVRIELFDRVNRELRNLRNMSENHSDKQEEGSSPVEDGIRKTLMNQRKTQDQQPTQ